MTTSVQADPDAPAVEPLPARRRFMPAGIRGWLYLAALVFVILWLVSILTSSEGDGAVVFGTGVSADREITGVAATFHVGDTIAYQARLKASVPGSELVIRITQTLADGTVHSQNGSTQAGTGNVNRIVSTEPLALNASDVGAWRLEVLRGDTVLASGEFTVVP